MISQASLIFALSRFICYYYPSVYHSVWDFLFFSFSSKQAQQQNSHHSVLSSDLKDVIVSEGYYNFGCSRFY